jgi:hypothetical protein
MVDPAIREIQRLPDHMEPKLNKTIDAVALWRQVAEAQLDD